MKRDKKILLGMLTAWPLLYIILFTVAFITMSFDYLLFVAHGLTMLLTLGLLIYYVMHVFKQDLPEGEKVKWAILLFVGGLLAMPIYWYLKIWKAPAAA
jgi:hypothetical protein